MDKGRAAPQFVTVEAMDIALAMQRTGISEYILDVARDYTASDPANYALADLAQAVADGYDVMPR